jgi:putative nucleotidyltransferase with HDIG domain
VIDPVALSRRIRTLPTLSGAVVALEQALARPNVRLDELERIISHDPALTANVLRTLNSGLYMLGKRVDSVRHGGLVLGLRRLRDLAVASAFTAVVPARMPGYGMDAAGFWSHCAAVAVLTGELAEEVGAVDKERAFVVGLLHDIGKLALSDFLADSGTDLLHRVTEGGLSFLNAERALLGTDHAEVGAELAKQWKLPEPVIHVALWHHDPPAAEKDPHGQLIDLVHVADALSHLIGCGWDVGELAREPHPSSLERLGLRPRQLEATVSRGWARIAEARQLAGTPEKS